MAVVKNDMPLIMNLNTPSNADVIKESLREAEAIDLYPEAEPLTESEQYIANLQSQYDSIYGVRESAEQTRRAVDKFLEDSKVDFLTLGIYTEAVQPILERQYSTEREYDIAINAIRDLVTESGADNLLDMFAHKNVYLAELGSVVEKHWNALREAVEEKFKEGLSEKDICDIEDADIKDFVIDCTDRLPKEVNDDIFRRVEGSIQDFVDDKKKNQFKIKRAYEDAKAKVDEYNKASEVVNGVKQTDGAGDSEDPELAIDDNLNAKLDAQNQMDIMAQEDPNNTDPTAIGPQPGVGLTPQQEAMAGARATESEVLEDAYNVFDGMLRIMVESCHKTKAIHDQYLAENGKSLSMQKLMNDTRAMYTVLEAVNALGIIDADEEYIKNMLHEMWEDSEKQADSNQIA